MIKGYDKVYLDKVMNLVADMYDYAVTDCGYDAEVFTDYFLSSRVASQIEIANPHYIGKSGIELTKVIIEIVLKEEINIEPQIHIHKTPIYWVGYVISYYQWVSQWSFMDIFKVVSIYQLLDMYPLSHETDIQKFVDVMDKKMKNVILPTHLQRIRRSQNLSQGQLALKAGVSKRIIQAYEQREKDINKAQIDNIKKIAKALNCYMEDLLEHEQESSVDYNE